MQRALMHYFKPYNRELVLKALKKAGREDLIGFGKDCLIPPRAVGRSEPPRAAGRSEPPREGKPARGKPPKSKGDKANPRTDPRKPDDRQRHGRGSGGTEKDKRARSRRTKR